MQNAMAAKRSVKPVLIACPEHDKLVRGSYRADPRGRFVRGRDGGFVLQYLSCSQLNGRCAQTLCALHRHNRRGPHSWVPERIFCMPEPRRRFSGISPTDACPDKASDLF
jgi:hypothetical protein